MKISKSERRAAQQFKARHGMTVTNTSIRLIAELAVKPVRKDKKRHV